MSHYLDKIFFINLDNRVDKREQIEKEFDKMNWTNYERYSGISTPDFGILGCSISHLNVLKIAKERNYQNILIFEDDFMFLVSKEVVNDNISKLFDNNVVFDICMLSYKIIKTESHPKYDFLLKVFDGQTASGYIIL
jgi:GR25 family glycosyltransferase involved in LPS biosynthesis